MHNRMTTAGQQVFPLIAAISVLAVLFGCSGSNTDTSTDIEPTEMVEPNSNSDDTYTPEPYVQLKNPEWSHDAVIYQINMRQFTSDGTFEAAARELPRLKELGVDILWLMPIHPIGEENRKGTLGSPYSVKDYYGVNPEFGTLDDFKRFVELAHEEGMYVILDWVANHTAWDNRLVEEHPDWYERNWRGDYRPTPWWDWSDIIDLDYSNASVREYMTEAMLYWVREAGVDGYRCDVAEYMPLDFWNTVRTKLDEIKPVFMLAEAQSRDLHARAFDASYAWDLTKALENIAAGNADTGALYGYYSGNESAWPMEAMRMTFTSNHDYNSWHGTEFELFGPAVQAAIVLTFTSEGIPVIYNGQESGNDKRLEFFEKDAIRWRDHPHGDLFKVLIELKKRNRALWNGRWGGRMVQALNDQSTDVFSFVREKDGDEVFVVINFSGEEKSAVFPEGPAQGRYSDVFTGISENVGAGWSVDLKPWGYRILSRENAL